MKITHICLCGVVTDNWSYQENLLPKYHKKLGYDVSVITSRYTRDEEGKLIIDDRINYENEYGIKTIRIDNKYKTNVRSKLKRYKNLYENIESESPDILFVHGLQFLDIRDIVKYSQQYPKVKVYIDNHADFSNSATNYLSRNLLHKVIWRKCAHLIEPYTQKFYGVLPARVDFLRDVYKLPKEKIELLVMGADDEKVNYSKSKLIRTEVRKQYNINPDDFLIITGGKIDKAKLQTLLLMQAVKEIKNENVKLLIFGSIENEILKDVNSLVDGSRIQYIGWIKSEECYKYFAASDLAVFPGRHSVLWEQAVGTGLPCIFKYWEGTTHVDLGGNCEFLYKDSKKEIKNSIENLLNNYNSYNNMKKVSEERGISEFSYLEIAKQSIEI